MNNSEIIEEIKNNINSICSDFIGQPIDSNTINVVKDSINNSLKESLIAYSLLSHEDIDKLSFSVQQKDNIDGLFEIKFLYGGEEVIITSRSNRDLSEISMEEIIREVLRVRNNFIEID